MKLLPNPELKLTTKDLKTWKYWTYRWDGDEHWNKTSSGWWTVSSAAIEAKPVQEFETFDF